MMKILKTSGKISSQEADLFYRSSAMTKMKSKIIHFQLFGIIAVKPHLKYCIS